MTEEIQHDIILLLGRNKGIEMSELLERLKKSKELPLGHYERGNAQKAVDEEYKLSNQVFYKWDAKVRKALGNFYITPEEGAKIVGELTILLGLTKLNKMIFSSPEVHPFAAAHYDKRSKEIHFSGSWCNIMTLIHELAHHVHYWDWGVRGEVHGPEFAKVQDLLFEVLVNYCGEKRNG